MSVCQNSRAKIFQISQRICISMSHSSHSPLLIVSDPALNYIQQYIWCSWSGSDWQNSLWRGTGGIYERRKCVNCHERVWPHVTNLAWHEGMSRDKVTGADPCTAGAGGGWPGNCLTRSRPGQCQARGVGANKIWMEINKKSVLKVVIILVLCLAFHSSICSRGCKCFNDLIPDDLWHCLLPLEGLSPIPVTDDATHTSWQWQPFYHIQWTFHIFVPPLSSTWTTRLACFALFCIMWYLRPYFMLTKTLPAINWIFSPLETFHRYTSTNIHLSRKVSYKFHD